MSATEEDTSITKRPTPFFMILKKNHTLPRVSSYDKTPAAIELQSYVDAGRDDLYGKRLTEFTEQGLNFRLTDMKVFETKDEGETIDVRVAVQVKKASITWYFWVKDGKDQYPQEFRDKLYLAAGECHSKVDRGCDLYYRGSNAYHLKLMHDLEGEAYQNHNHYRMSDDEPVEPHDFRQHLQAFKAHIEHDTFFEEGEVDKLCGRFDEYWLRWTAKEIGKASKKQRYETHPSQILNEEDVLEFQHFGIQQEPCRIDVSELKVDYEKARQLIKSSLMADLGSEERNEIERQLAKVKQEYQALLEYRKVGGSRGLGSERMHTRQIEGSSLPTIKEVVAKDDDLGKKQVIPRWAGSVIKEVERVGSLIESSVPEEKASPQMVRKSKTRAHSKGNLRESGGITMFSTPTRARDIETDELNKSEEPKSPTG
jgi:hypothetical protein